MPTADAPILYPDRLRVRAPRGLSAAIEVAADRRHTNPSEWIRQSLLRALQQDGVRLCDGRVEMAADRCAR